MPIHPNFAYIIIMNIDNNTIIAFDRFILASNFKRIESRYSMAKLPELVSYIPSFNIAPCDKTYIINNNQTKEIKLFDFGLKVNGDFMSFVRAEGDRNSDDNQNYKGSKAIFLKPEFNRLIRHQRCLVLADAFIVGIETGNPYLVYLRGKQRPFSFAGIWNRTKDETTGEEIYSFAIITCVANPLLQKLGLKRMPVMLLNEYENTWLRTSAQLSDILSMLSPYPANLMNTYPISAKIADKSLNDVSLVQPIGKTVYTEPTGYQRVTRLKQGKGNFSHITLAERMTPGT
jgi:putative SOS response-associated peptidase YedK